MSVSFSFSSLPSFIFSPSLLLAKAHSIAWAFMIAPSWSNCSRPSVVHEVISRKSRWISQFRISRWRSFTVWVRYVSDFVSLLYKCISHWFSTLHDSILAQSNCYRFPSCTCRLVPLFLAPNMTILTCFEVSYTSLLGMYVRNSLSRNLIFGIFYVQNIVYVTSGFCCRKFPPCGNLQHSEITIIPFYFIALTKYTLVSMLFLKNSPCGKQKTCSSISCTTRSNINEVVCVIFFFISSLSFILSCILQSLFTVYEYHWFYSADTK